MRKYNSQYDGEELNSSVTTLDKSWIQLEVTGGYPGDELLLTPGATVILTNKIPYNVASSLDNWTKLNVNNGSVYSENKSVQYPNYDLFIIPSSSTSGKSKITYTVETIPNHVYYLQVFVDGLNSNNIDHGIGLESTSGAIYISSTKNDLTPLTMSCYYKVGNDVNNMNIVLYARATSTNTTNEVHFGRLTLVDLTASFGAGYEADKKWCDEHIDIYSPDGQYKAGETLSLKSEFSDIIKYFDSDGKCLFNLPGFATWFPRLSSSIYNVDAGSQVVDTVKKYTININNYNIPTLIKNGSLSVNKDNWNYSSDWSTYYNSPSFSGGGLKLSAIANGSVNTNFPIYQDFRLTSNNNFQDVQKIYIQAKVKSPSSGNSTYPVVRFGHYNTNDVNDISIYKTNLISIDGKSGTQLNDGNWHTVSLLQSSYDSDGGTVYAWKKYNIVAESGYGLKEVALSDDAFATDYEDFYVSNTYSLNQQTGLFSTNQNVKISSNSVSAFKECVGKYLTGYANQKGNLVLHYPSSATNYTDQTYLAYIYKVNEDWMWLVGPYFRINLYIAESTTVYNKTGSSIGIVVSTNSNAYPENGVKDGYWYEKLDGFRNKNNSVEFGLNEPKSNNSMWIKDVLAINLTENFGAGKEPSKEWCDKYINFNNII